MHLKVALKGGYQENWRDFYGLDNPSRGAAGSKLIQDWFGIPRLEPTVAIDLLKGLFAPCIS